MNRTSILPLTALVLVLIAVVSVSCSPTESGYEGFTFAPDGTYLLSVYFNGSASFIYKIRMSTGQATRLTSVAGGYEGIPSFSADGRRITYSYSPGREAKSRIIVSNADGTEPRTFGNSETSDFRPLFSPDNKTIVFARAGYYGSYSPIARPAQHEWNFFISDVDGGNARQITNEDFYMVSRGSVSPDGKTLAFVSSQQHGDLIELHSLEQPPKPKVTFQPHVQGEPSGGPIFNDPNYLPDGKAILFLAASDGRSAFDYDIYQMDLSTQKLEKLTSQNGYTEGLQLSRDGKTAVFLRTTSKWFGRKTQAFLFDLSNRKARLLEIGGIR